MGSFVPDQGISGPRADMEIIIIIIIILKILGQFLKIKINLSP